MSIDPAPPARRHRVFIVEDEAVIAEELRIRLRRMGLEVVGSVCSAEEAIESVAQTAPDLVLMDIQLEGAMDGIEGAATIRERYGVPAVFLSAYSDDATIERAKRTDPFGYVLKPFNERDLRIAIEIALHKHAVDTALHQAETQVQRAQSMDAIGQLAGGVAQDINNMMTVVLGYTDLLLRHRDLTEDKQHMLQEIRRAANRSAEVAHQLLAFGQRQILRPAAVDLNRLAVTMRTRLSRLLGADIRLRFALDPELGSVVVDASQLDAVVLNLCLNARDAMPDGGVLTIVSRNVTVDAPEGIDAPEMASGPYVMLAISDTGRGMDPETTSHVFEPFFTTKRVGDGTGLGLAMVYGIVKQSGGHLYVESEVGRGTTFTIFLPRAEA